MHRSRVLRIAPMKFTSLYMAVGNPSPSTLIDELHTAILRTLFSDAGLFHQQLPWGNIDTTNLDIVSWPEYLRQYLKARLSKLAEMAQASNDDDVDADDKLYFSLQFSTEMAQVVQHLEAGEYYTLPPAAKVHVLQALLDNFMEAKVVRDEVEFRVARDCVEIDEDLCTICGDGGTLILCEVPPKRSH